MGLPTSVKNLKGRNKSLSISEFNVHFLELLRLSDVGL